MADPLFNELILNDDVQPPQQASQLDSFTQSLFRPQPDMESYGIDYLRAEQEFGSAGTGAVKQAGRGLVTGFVGAATTTMRSIETANQFLEEKFGVGWERSRTLYDVADEWENSLVQSGFAKSDPRFRGDFLVDTLPQAIGNLSAQLAAVALTRRVPNVSPTAAGFFLLGSQAAQSEFERAIADGRSRDDAFRIYSLNFLAQGAMETIVLNRMADRISAGGSFGRRVLASTAENAASGALEVVMSDIFASRQIDLTEVLESAAVEAIAGGVVDISATTTLAASRGLMARMRTKPDSVVAQIESMGVSREQAEAMVYDDLMLIQDQIPQSGDLVSQGQTEPSAVEIAEDVDNQLTREQARRVQEAPDLPPELYNYTTPTERAKQAAAEAAVATTREHRQEDLFTIIAAIEDSSPEFTAETIDMKRFERLDKINDAIGRGYQKVVEADTTAKINKLAQQVRTLSSKLSQQNGAAVIKAVGANPTRETLYKALTVARTAVVEQQTAEAQSLLKKSISKAEEALKVKGRESKVDIAARGALEILTNLLTSKRASQVKRENFDAEISRVSGEDSPPPGFSLLKKIRNRNRISPEDLDASDALLLSTIIDNLVTDGKAAIAAINKGREKRIETITENVMGEVSQSNALTPLAEGQAIGRDEQNVNFVKKFGRLVLGNFEAYNLETVVMALSNGNEDSSTYKTLFKAPFRASVKVEAYKQMAEDSLLKYATEDLGLAVNDMVELSDTLTRGGGLLGRGKGEGQKLSFTVKNSKGKDVNIEMTAAQAMDIYAYAHDPMAMERIILGKQVKDGKVVAPLKLKFTDDPNARDFVLDYDSYLAMENAMPQTWKNLVSFMVNYVNTINRGEVQSWSEKVLNRDITTTDTYWPLKVQNQRQVSNSDIEDGSWMSAVAGNDGITKDRVQFSDSTIIVGDVFLKFLEHQKRVAAVTQASDALITARKVIEDNRFKEMLGQHREGARAISRLKRDYDVIVKELISQPVSEGGPVQDFTRAIRNNVTTAAVGLNPLLATFQVVSSLNYATQVPAKFVWAAIGEGAMFSDAVFDRMMKSAYIRSRMDRSAGSVVTENVEGATPPVFGRRSARDSFFFMVRGFDTAAIKVGWRTAEIMVEHQLQGRKVSDETRAVMVEELAVDLIRKTQPTQDTFSMSGLGVEAKTGDSLAILLSQFMSQRFKNMNIMAQAGIKGGGTGPFIMRGLLTKAAGVIVINSLLISLLRELTQAILGENRGKDLKQVTKETAGRTINSFFSNALFLDRFSDFAMRLTDRLAMTIPDDGFDIFGTEGKYFSGHGTTAVDGSIEDLSKDFYRLTQRLTADEVNGDDVAESVFDLIIDGGMLSGVPFTAAARDVIRGYNGWSKELKEQRKKRIQWSFD